MDTQQIEIVGRSLLTALLVADGIEVAMPIRDRGVDLVAYLDGDAFDSVPIQLKVNSKTGFSVNRKYEKFNRLRIVTLWNVHDPREAPCFCTTYEETVAIAAELGWTATNSWIDKGQYSVTNPGQKVLEMLKNHKVESGGWKQALFGFTD